jgi:xanthine dehydrogenase YagT iron-sulfur-binding subunit
MGIYTFWTEQIPPVLSVLTEASYRQTRGGVRNPRKDESLPRPVMNNDSLTAVAGPAIDSETITTNGRPNPETETRFAPRRWTHVQINGVEHSFNVEARTTLLDLLREQVQLTGTKKGCNRGECGACTVLMDNRRVNACLVLAVSADGKKITTIEGLACDGVLHPVQRAFIEHDAFQCGFCTCGQIMSAVGCIAEGHTGSNAEIREWMSGNICRCSAYPQIAAAVEAAAKEMG